MDAALSYAIEASRVTLLGRRLEKLAMFGEVLTIVALVGVPLALVSIAIPANTERGFIDHLISLYAGELGLFNVYGLLLAVLQLVLMDVLRRLGASLASDAPFGSASSRLMHALAWLVAAFGMASAVKPQLDVCLQAPEVRFDFNLMPLLFCVILAIGLGLMRSLVMAARALKVENEGFI